jgi:hypothetical protein
MNAPHVYYSPSLPRVVLLLYGHAAVCAVCPVPMILLGAGLRAQPVGSTTKVVAKDSC